MRGRAISYLRVSTARQGTSGLGLEAQRDAVTAFAAIRGLELLEEYVEIESGKRDDRPALKAALGRARQLGVGTRNSERLDARFMTPFDAH